MESKCLTHLEHNLPDLRPDLPEAGVDRYCIHLVCIDGLPVAAGYERLSILSHLQDESVLQHDEFDASSYQSSAKLFSEKYSDRSELSCLFAISYCCFSMPWAILLLTTESEVPFEKEEE